MLTNLDEIKTAVDAYFNDSLYTSLKTKWESDFELYRMTEYNAGKGYSKYTSNAPRVLIDKILSMLVGANLIIRMPIEILGKDERLIAGNCERFDYGALNLADELLTSKRMPSIREQMAWYTAVRGGFSGRAYMTKGKDGETIPDVAIWDIYNTAFGGGWVCHRRRATKEDIATEYDIEVADDNTTVYDFWDTEKNGVIIANEWGRPLKAHGLDFNPAFVKSVGTMPVIWQGDDQDINVERFQSALSANRGLYPILNKTISDLLTIVRRGVKVPMGIWSASGDTIDEDIWQVEKGAFVHLSPETIVKPLIEMTMPNDAYRLLEIISGEEQRGGISHISYGQVATRLSGFAINQLQAAMDTTVASFIETMRQSYNEIVVSLAAQYADGGFKPIRVRGRTSRDESFGYPEGYQIKTSDIRKDWKPEVRLEAVLPKDDAQKVLMATQLRQEDSRQVPLISDQTLQDAYLGVKDPDLEQEKIKRQLADMTPLIRLQDAFEAYMADNQPNKAAAIAVEMQRVILDMQGRVAAAQGAGAQQLGGLGQEAAGLPGAGIPSGETGFQSQFLPAESLGGLPGGAMGAAPAGEGE